MTARQRFYTTQEAADELRISERQVRHLISRGVLHTVQGIGRRLIIPVESFDLLAAGALEHDRSAAEVGVDRRHDTEP